MKVFALVVLLVAAAQAAKSKPKEAFLDIIPGAPAPVKGDTTRIVNGQKAKRGQFPHYALLEMDRTYCGGSLISTEWVLTAAHCVQDHRSFAITLGDHNRKEYDPGQITVMTSTKILHDGFIRKPLVNDIALLKLPKPVTLSNNIKLVSLPSRSDAGNNFAGTTVTASGWGFTIDIEYPDELSYVDLKVMGNADCGKYYGSNNIISSVLCCAAPGGRSTCFGDSGGPLILQGSNPPKQIAVNSFVGKAGCASGNPSGYARLTSHLDWIQKNTGITIK